MTPDELAARYKADVPSLKKLGNEVNAYITESLTVLLGGEQNISQFLQMPAVPRVKNLDSLISKAFYRGHPPSDDPYSAIKDKVGVRYVVLLERHIHKVEEIVKSNTKWHIEKLRDYRDESAERPDVFGYQSVHYIVYTAEYGSHLQCEIQIPTILQHAWNAVTHDTTYKAKIPPGKHEYRLVARSMALLEATESFFTKTDDMIETAFKKYKDTLDDCVRVYDNRVDAGHNVDEKVSLSLYNQLAALESHVTANDLEALLADHATLPRQIKRTAKHNFLYRQPIILYALYVASRHWLEIEHRWSLNKRDLDLILLDVEKASPD